MIFYQVIDFFVFTFSSTNRDFPAVRFWRVWGLLLSPPVTPCCVHLISGREASEAQLCLLLLFISLRWTGFLRLLCGWCVRMLWAPQLELHSGQLSRQMSRNCPASLLMLQTTASIPGWMDKWTPTILFVCFYVISGINLEYKHSLFWQQLDSYCYCRSVVETRDEYIPGSVWRLKDIKALLGNSFRPMSKGSWGPSRFCSYFSSW